MIIADRGGYLYSCNFHSEDAGLLHNVIVLVYAAVLFIDLRVFAAIFSSKKQTIRIDRMNKNSIQICENNNGKYIAISMDCVIISINK